MIGPESESDMLRDSETELRQRLDDERNDARREGHQYAVECQFPLKWSGGAPEPTVLSSQTRTFLIFFLEDRDSRVGKVEFEHVWSTRFGEPNENGIMEHPLVGYGLDGWSPSEVINSSWIEEIKKRASVHEGFDPGRFDGRHFLFPFHDSTFECVARSFEAVEVEEDYRTTIRTCSDLL